ncbi:hypothetical protein ACFORK_21350 [Paenibacillus sp. GCM10012306]
MYKTNNHTGLTSACRRREQFFFMPSKRHLPLHPDMTPAKLIFSLCFH